MQQLFKRAFVSSFLCLTPCILPVLAHGQEQSAVSGQLNGQVTDPSGAVIADASVAVTGPQGTLALKTDRLGRFTAASLTPGFYNVVVTKPGFGKVQSQHNEVTVGTAATLNLTMSVGSETTTVEVTAQAVQIDTQSTAVTSNLTDTFYNAVPMQRNVTAIFYAAPGVAAGQVNTAPNQAGPGSANPSIGGASGLENLYIVDGVTITDQAFGSIGTYNRYHGSLGTGINLAFVKEVDVKTTAFEPSYGKALGGIVNIVTKSGGNAYHGALSAYFSPSAFWASRYQYYQFGYQQTTPGSTLSQPAFDAAIEIGGYIPRFRDKLFFFGAWDPSLSQAYVAANPGAPSQSVALGTIHQNTTSVSYAGKLTYRITDRSTLELTGFGDPSRHNAIPNSLSSSAPLTTSSSWNFGSEDELARLDAALTPTWTVDLAYAYNHNHFNEIPASTQYQFTDTNPQYFTPTPGASVVTGLGPFEPSKNNTYSVEANTSKILRLFGQHTFNFGYTYDHTDFLDLPSRSGALFAIPSQNAQGQNLSDLFSTIPARAPGSLTNALFQIAPANPNNPLDPTCTLCPVIDGFKSYASISRGTYQGLTVNASGRYHSGYGEDVYQMNKYLTFNIGVRYEDQRVGGTLFSYNFGPSWSPRMGVNIDPLGDQRSKVFFNFGRNYWALPLDAAIRQLGNEQDDTSYVFAPTVNADGSISITPDAAHTLNGTPKATALGVTSSFGGPNFSSSTGEGIVPGTRQEYEDEYVLGVEHEISKSIVVKIHYTDRRLGRIIEDIGSQSPEGATILPNYNGGITNPGPGTDIAVNEQEVTYTPAQFNAANGAALASSTGLTVANYTAPVAGCTFANDTYPSGIKTFFTNGRNQPVGGACFLNKATADAGPGDGIPDGFVKPIRRYNAIEMELDKRFSNHWLAVANFRWGNLWGNYEGAYRNDNGQSDPGISSLFDFTPGKLGLLGDQFTPGFLSSDRRTIGNIFLSYNIGGDTPWVSGLRGLTVGLGARGQSGVPLSFFGDHPIYLNQGEIPIGGRGAAGRTPSSTQLDMHMDYPVPLGTHFGDKYALKLAMDMFNVTNSQFETGRVQFLQNSSPQIGAVPPLDTDYGRPTSFQGPFYARGSVRFEF